MRSPGETDARSYARTAEDGESLCKPASLSACSSCGAARTCKLEVRRRATSATDRQILSTLIAALGVDDTAQDSLDFGTLLVYTRTASCDPPPDGCAVELAAHQPVAANGVDLRSGPAASA